MSEHDAPDAHQRKHSEQFALPTSSSEIQTLVAKHSLHECTPSVAVKMGDAFLPGSEVVPFLLRAAESLYLYHQAAPVASRGVAGRSTTDRYDAIVTKVNSARMVSTRARVESRPR